jgi:hypothetical protein
VIQSARSIRLVRLLPETAARPAIMSFLTAAPTAIERVGIGESQAHKDTYSLSVINKRDASRDF